MPLLANIYRIKRQRDRQILLAAAALAAALAWHLLSPFLSKENEDRLWLSLAAHIQYFLVGLSLADLYVTNWNSFGKQAKSWDWVSLIGWPLLLGSWWLVPTLAAFAAPFLMVPLYVAAFRGPVTNRIARYRWLGVTGGMCYSIYLLHLQVIAASGALLRPFVNNSSYVLTCMVHLAAMLPPILLVSTIYFVLVEKPCMDRDWPRKLARRLRIARTA
jgi:peptidoglycan/LPS O-acetylase OafA/YrhL